MRTEHTGYEVPGWGRGDLWTRDGVVLAHELEFRLGPAGPSWAVPRPEPRGHRQAHPESHRQAHPESHPQARPPKGAPRPPTRTLAASGARVGRAFVPSSSHPEPVPQAPVERARQALDSPTLIERFVAFFAGSDETFADVPLDLEWTTPFQRAVVDALRAVPRGEVVAYGELASLAGYPGAARAVGTLCAHNRFMLIVPCHRVVGATGLGGYGTAGLEVKRRLLALEGVRL